MKIAEFLWIVLTRIHCYFSFYLNICEEQIHVPWLIEGHNYVPFIIYCVLNVWLDILLSYESHFRQPTAHPDLPAFSRPISGLSTDRGLLAPPICTSLHKQQGH